MQIKNAFMQKKLQNIRLCNARPRATIVNAQKKEAEASYFSNQI